MVEEKIVNYRVFPVVKEIQVPFIQDHESLICYRWKWAEKPLKWLLKFLNCHRISKQVECSTITINQDDIKHQILESCNAYYAYTMQSAKRIVIGRKQMNALRISADLVHTQMNLDCARVFGYEIILHPFIDGIVPLE